MEEQKDNSINVLTVSFNFLEDGRIRTDLSKHKNLNFNEVIILLREFADQIENDLKKNKINERNVN